MLRLATQNAPGYLFFGQYAIISPANKGGLRQKISLKVVLREETYLSYS